MDDSTGVLALIMGALAFVAVFSLVFWLYLGFCLGRLFERAGKPMWTGFVPIYNWMIWAEITGRPNWWVAVWIVAFLASWIMPFIGTLAVWAVLIISSVDLAKSFGKDTTFGVLMGIFFPIMAAILAFGDDAYVGPSVTAQQ
ncbi:MAG: signal peptidase I [Bacteroidetes bacterium]|nr:signal peptidase I [Bacteroidota bacterium]